MLTARVHKAQEDFKRFGGIHWYSHHAKDAMQLISDLHDEVLRLQKEVQGMVEDAAGEDL